MKYTANYNLKKPDETDVVNVKDLNDNADIIDSELKKAYDKAVDAPVKSVNGKTGDVELTKSDIGLGNVTNDKQATEVEFDTHKEDYISHAGYGTASGTNVKTITLSPVPSGYKEGMTIAFKNVAQNTGAVTLNVNSLGAKPVLKSNGNALSSGNLKKDSIYTVRYNGSNFILQGEGGEYGTADPSDVIKGKTIGTEDGIKTGTLELTGDALVSNVLTGKTFYKDNPKSKATGTMPNNGAINKTITKRGEKLVLNEGYYSGGEIIADYGGYIKGDEIDLNNISLVTKEISPTGSRIFMHFSYYKYHYPYVYTDRDTGLTYLLKEYNSGEVEVYNSHGGYFLESLPIRIKDRPKYFRKLKDGSYIYVSNWAMTRYNSDYSKMWELNNSSDSAVMDDNEEYIYVYCQGNFYKYTINGEKVFQKSLSNHGGVSQRYLYYINDNEIYMPKNQTSAGGTLKLNSNGEILEEIPELVYKVVRYVDGYYYTYRYRADNGKDVSHELRKELTVGSQNPIWSKPIESPIEDMDVDKFGRVFVVYMSGKVEGYKADGSKYYNYTIDKEGGRYICRIYASDIGTLTMAATRNESPYNFELASALIGVKQKYKVTE